MELHPGSQTQTVSNTAQYLQFTGNFIQNKPVIPDLVTLSFKGPVMPKDDLVQFYVCRSGPLILPVSAQQQ